jgi:hypothetical protein
VLLHVLQLLQARAAYSSSSQVCLCWGCIGCEVHLQPAPGPHNHRQLQHIKLTHKSCNGLQGQLPPRQRWHHTCDTHSPVHQGQALMTHLAQLAAACRQKELHPLPVGLPTQAGNPVRNPDKVQRTAAAAVPQLPQHALQIHRAGPALESSQQQQQPGNITWLQQRQLPMQQQQLLLEPLGWWCCAEAGQALQGLKYGAYKCPPG